MYHIQNTKLPKQQYDKIQLMLGYIKIQNIRIKTYNRQKVGGGWKYRHGAVGDICHWGFKPCLGAPNLTLVPSRPIRHTV